MELRTDRLMLRDPTHADLPDIHSWASDPLVSTFVAWGPSTEKDTRAYLADCLAEQAESPRRAWNLAVFLDDTVVGSVGLTRGGWDSAEVGCVVHPDHWGRGIATEAFAALVRFGLDELGLHRLTATCRPGNDASARVLERTGFTLEGRLRDHLRIRGEWQDSLLYSRLPDDDTAASPVENAWRERDLGAGLVLEPLHPHHAPDWSRLVTTDRAHLGRWIAWVWEDFTVDRAQADIARQRRMPRHRPAALPFAVVQDGEMVGFTNLFDIRTTRSEAEIGYLVGSAASGRGIATRSLDAMCRLAFEDIGLRRVTLRTATTNTASRRVAERAGFTLEGVLRDAWQVRGERQDLATYSRLVTDHPT